MLEFVTLNKGTALGTIGSKNKNEMKRFHILIYKMNIKTQSIKSFQYNNKAS